MSKCLIRYDRFECFKALDPELKNQLALIFAYINGYEFIFENDWRVVVFCNQGKLEEFIFDNQFLPRSIVYPLFMTIRAEFFKKVKEAEIIEP